MELRSLMPGAVIALLLFGNSQAAEDPASSASAIENLSAASTLLGVPVADGRLAAFRGGTDVRNDARTIGDVAGNNASHVVTGMNVLQEGAFAHASGITTVVQNSGANVLIQNAMVVDVQFGVSGQ